VTALVVVRLALLAAVAWRVPAVAPRGRIAPGGTARRVHGRVAVATAVLLVGWALAGAWAAALLVAGAGLQHSVRRRMLAARSRAGARRALPDVIDLLTLTMRAGHTPLAAISVAAGVAGGPARAALDDVVLRTQRGERLADALGALVTHLGPEAAPVADALGAADRDGIPIGPVLEELATEARAVRRRLAAADARTLPVRLAFPLVTCTLPAFVLLTVVPVLLATWTSLAAPP
jgi:Flp pilus assembly protein TadB